MRRLLTSAACGAGPGRRAATVLGASGSSSSSSSSMLLLLGRGRAALSSAAATAKPAVETVQFQRAPKEADDARKRRAAAAGQATRRTGAIALKVGMIGVYDQWGQRHACTVLALDKNQVVQVKKEETDGYIALQLGAGEKKAKNVTQPERGHFERWIDGNTGATPAKRRLWEFRVSPDAVLPPGTPVLAQHFVPGQKVDVCGYSKGKGFAGVMKRWNFGGQGASHGVSLTHRSLGSTGQNTSPGRVFKGKKMPGRLGGERTTVQNLWLYKIDTEQNLLYIKGHVPGNKGAYVRVTDAVKGPDFPAPPPVPTFIPEPGVNYPKEISAPAPEVDPLLPPEGSEDD